MGMKATVVSFRRGRHTHTMNQLLLEMPGVDSKALASGFIGKRVKWTSPGKLKKEIFGKITNIHGSNGVVRARFSRGLPGEIVGKKVDILE
jgi:large subunit ribosomal protein L35Ae